MVNGGGDGVNIVGRGKHLYSVSLTGLRVQLVYRVCQIPSVPTHLVLFMFCPGDRDVGSLLIYFHPRREQIPAGMPVDA